MRQFFSTQGYLFEEPSNLLKQELRNAARYNSVIEAIAEGATRLNEIAEKCRLESGITAHCIETLTSLGIVRKESCILMQSSRKLLPFTVLNIGRWWGTDPNKKQQEEIDIVAVNPYEKSALFAECKYHNTPADEQVLDRLIEKSSLVQGFAVRRYFIFSKSGFTPGLIRAAEEREVRLVTLDELYS